MNDARWLDDLDAAWDDLAAGGQSNPLLDLDTDRTISRLHALQTAADVPLAAHERVWSPPTRSRRRAHLRALRFGTIHAYALIAVLLFASMAGAYSTSRRENDSLNVAASLPAASDLPLYRISSKDGSWQKIDARTLQPIPGVSGPALQFDHLETDTLHESVMGISRDGSTVWTARTTSSQNLPQLTSHRFYDASTGHLRSTIQIHSPYLLNSASLSANGSRFVTFRAEASQRTSYGSTVTGLELYDTANGALSRSIDLSFADADVVGRPIVDPSASHAYVVILNYADQEQHPDAASLVTYDLNSGDIVGKVEIDGMIRTNVIIRERIQSPPMCKSRRRQEQYQGTDARWDCCLGMDESSLSSIFRATVLRQRRWGASPAFQMAAHSGPRPESPSSRIDSPFPFGESMAKATVG